MEETNLTYEQYEEELEKLHFVHPDENKEAWQQWQNQRIALSQRVKVYTFEGKDYQRIPCGEDYRIHPLTLKRLPYTFMNPDQMECSDCGVARGQLHIPGCDIETCPKCEWQALSCGCDAEDEEEDDDGGPEADTEDPTKKLEQAYLSTRKTAQEDHTTFVNAKNTLIKHFLDHTFPNLPCSINATKDDDEVEILLPLTTVLGIKAEDVEVAVQNYLRRVQESEQ